MDALNVTCQHPTAHHALLASIHSTAQPPFGFVAQECYRLESICYAVVDLCPALTLPRGG
jgi:hypothetical protein